jgi:ferrous iron transport protein A
MVKLFPLNQLPIGYSAKIIELNSDSNMRRRLLDLGFVKGSTVRSIQAAPSGDPIAYCIKGAIIALRNDDAKEVIVKSEDSTKVIKGSVPINES